MGQRELKDRLQPDVESVSIPKRAFTQYMMMHASVLVVLQKLESQENNINPSLLVIRDCIRELRRYNDNQRLTPE